MGRGRMSFRLSCRIPEEYGEQDCHKQRIAGKNIPGSTPVAYCIEDAVHLGRICEMVHYRLCTDHPDRSPDTVCHQHEQTLCAGADVLSSPLIDIQGT